MPKRVAATKEPAAKKMKTESAAPEAPLLEALGLVDLPKTCRELLQTALPHCLATSPSERHKFQLVMLDRITTMFDNVEEQKRATLNEEESQLASIRAEKDAAAADLETKKEATLNKKNECDEKSSSVTGAKEDVTKATEAVSAANQQAEELATKKAERVAAQEAFQDLLKESWQPLKDGALNTGTSWQKRHKAIADFLKKASEQVQMEGSLLDAIEATLKMKPEQRTKFAQLALEHAEDCFKNHADSIVQQTSVLAEEEVAHQAIIEAAKTSLVEKEKQQEDAEKDWESEQNKWVDLENIAAEAASKLKNTENKLDDASKIVESLAGELQYFVEIPALLSKLKDGSPTNEEPAETTIPEQVEAVEPMPVLEAVEPMEPAPVALEVA